jgi:hypothetical protein
VRKIFNTISLIFVVSLLSACGGSGSGVPASAPSASLDGTVTDAVITNGTLRVYKFDEGKRGELIAETVTDGNGDFEIADFASQDRPVVIEVSGGRYMEEASGVSVDLLAGQVLRAYMFYEQHYPAHRTYMHVVPDRLTDRLIHQRLPQYNDHHSLQ